MNASTEPHASGRRPGKSAAAFRTISEVATELDLPQHVLRFWESKFPQIRPMKRGGGRRYYRPEDLDLLRRIRALLYEDGYTIKGVQKILRDHSGRVPLDGGGRGEGVSQPAAEQPAPPQAAEMAADAPAGGPDRTALRAVLDELERIRKLL